MNFSPIFSGCAALGLAISEQLCAVLAILHVENTQAINSFSSSPGVPF